MCSCRPLTVFICMCARVCMCVHALVHICVRVCTHVRVRALVSVCALGACRAACDRCTHMSGA